MYYMLVACMAGPLDTGQQIATYLLLPIIPLLLYHLVYLVLPEDPMSFRLLEKTIAQTSAWRLRGHPHDARPKRFKCFKKPKKKIVREEIQDKTIKHTITKKLPSYLMPAFFAAFKVGCCVEDKGQTPPFPSSPPAGSMVLGTPRCFSWQSSGPIRLGSTTMHRDAWPTPPTSSRTSTSSTTQGR